MNCDLATHLCVPRPIFDWFQAVDNEVCPRLADAESFHDPSLPASLASMRASAFCILHLPCQPQSLIGSSVPLMVSQSAQSVAGCCGRGELRGLFFCFSLICSTLPHIRFS